MNATTPPDEKASTRTATPRPNYVILGRDAIGNQHLYRTKDETILILDAGGRITDRHGLADRPLDDYRDFVADRRGWSEYRPRVTADITEPFAMLRRDA